MITYREIQDANLPGSFNFLSKRERSLSYPEELPEEFQLVLNNDPLEKFAKIDTDNSKNLFQRIHKFLERFKTNFFESGTARKWKETLESMISNNLVIRMAVTGFPVKSLDTKKMVLSRDIDVTDFWCFRMYVHICKEIESIYPPGATITIYSDGIPLLTFASDVVKCVLSQEGIQNEEKKVFEILYSVLEKLEEGSEKYIDNCRDLLSYISNVVTFCCTKNLKLSSFKEQGSMGFVESISNCVNSLGIKKEYVGSKNNKDYDSIASFWKSFIGEEIFEEPLNNFTKEEKQQYIEKVIEKLLEILDEAGTLFSKFQKDQERTEYLHLSYRPRNNIEQKVSCVFIYGHNVKAVPWTLVPILGYKKTKRNKKQKRYLSLSFKHKSEIFEFKEENIKSFTLGGIELKYYNAIDDQKQQLQNAGLESSEKTENGEGKEGEKRKKAKKDISQIAIPEKWKEGYSKPTMTKRIILRPLKGKSFEDLQKELEEDTRTSFIFKRERQNELWIYFKEEVDISKFKDTASRAWPKVCCLSNPLKLITDEKFKFLEFDTRNYYDSRHVEDKMKMEKGNRLKCLIGDG